MVIKVDQNMDQETSSTAITSRFNDLAIREIITCPKCPGKIFKKKKAFYSHNSVVHGERRFKCEKCDKMFPFQSQLVRHAKHHFHICSICDETFSNYHRYQKHQMEFHWVVHPNKIECKFFNNFPESYPSCFSSYEIVFILNILSFTRFCLTFASLRDFKNNFRIDVGRIYLLLEDQCQRIIW